jgi:hypothetical protein
MAIAGGRRTWHLMRKVLDFTILHANSWTFAERSSHGAAGNRRVNQQ